MSYKIMKVMKRWCKMMTIGIEIELIMRRKGGEKNMMLMILVSREKVNKDNQTNRVKWK